LNKGLRLFAARLSPESWYVKKAKAAIEVGE